MPEAVVMRMRLPSWLYSATSRVTASSLVLAILLCAARSYAHKSSDAYLTLRMDGGLVEGQLDVALRDLDTAIGLDTDNNGAITWGELRSHHDAIAAYVLSRLSIAQGSQACGLRVTEQLVDRHSDGAYAVLRFTTTCAAPASRLHIRYSLLFDIDQQHRGLARIEHAGRTDTAVFGPETSEQQIDLNTIGAWGSVAQFWREGVWHIWFGYDHVLFLLTLLLPAVLLRRGRGWEAAHSFRPALTDTMKVVTAFTVAHSITLTLAALGMVAVPTRLVESGIALSIVLAAVNNAYPFFQGNRWVVAFGFGLLHGFGFAAVLAGPGLPSGALVSSLLGFNLGVESGQLVIVAAFLPFAYALRRSWLYQRLSTGIGASLIALIGTVWLLERAFNLRLLHL